MARITSFNPRGELFLTVGVATMLAVLLAACGSPPPTPTSDSLTDEAEAPVATTALGLYEGVEYDPAFVAEWEALIAAARAEGRFVMGRISGRTHRMHLEFEDIFGIKTIGTAGSGSSAANRLLAEQSVGRYEVDYMSAGTGSTARVLLPANALVPVAPYLMHPEVVDESLWYLGQLWYEDEFDKYSLIPGTSGLRTGPLGTTETWINTELVTAEEAASLQSLQDLLDPKWKGRIVIEPIIDNVSDIAEIWQTEELGPEWLTAFFVGQEVFVAPDRGYVLDSIALGRYSVTTLTSIGKELQEYGMLGLPVQELELKVSDTEQLAFRLGGGQARIQIPKNPPHPNALTLYINWFTSRAGQELWQNTPSLNERVSGVWDNPDWPGHDRISLRIDVGWGRTLVERRWDRNEYIPWPAMEEKDPRHIEIIQESQDFVRQLLRER